MNLIITSNRVKGVNKVKTKYLILQIIPITTVRKSNNLIGNNKLESKQGL
jgi:hypothetical protein